MPLVVGKFNVSAVLLGIAVDWVGSMVTGLVFWLAVRGWLSFKGVAEADATRVLEAPELWPLGFQLVMLAIGLAWTGAGGFVAARAAKQLESLHAGAVGLTSCLLGLLAAVGTSQSWWFTIGSALTPLVAVLGGYLGRATPRTTEARPRP